MKRFAAALLWMVVGLGLAACAASDSKPDDNKYGGFYGGMTGGMGP